MKYEVSQFLKKRKNYLNKIRKGRKLCQKIL